MRRTLLATLLGSALFAQTPAAVPALKWRGSLWASAVLQNRQTADGTLAWRPLDGGEGAFTLDGLTLGLDANLGQGWTARVTLLGGHLGRVVNETSGDSGPLAVPEAQLVWTNASDKVTLGRMNTFIGMEFTDGTQDLTASRGLLCTFAAPFTQVGLAWRHTWSPSWSTDVFLFNGEDRVRDNNRGKTAGLGLNYNHDGAADRYASLMLYRGAEQDGLGTAAGTGAESRKRDRIAFLGQWAWGPATLQWEFERGQEPFAASAIAGAQGPGDVKATWTGVALIYRHQLNENWALFARAEQFKDDTGVRLNYDSSIGAAYGATRGADLEATSFTAGLERKWGATFARFELRQDTLNRDLTAGAADPGRRFRSGASATLSVGSSF